MANPNSGRAAAGWAILAVALAVPAFSFLKWWSDLKSDQERLVSSKAAARKNDGTIFQTSSATRLVNPIAAPAHSMAASTTSAAQNSTAAIAATPPPPAPDPLPRPLDPAPSAVAPSEPQDLSVILPRDPMMSPMDLVRMREEEIRQQDEAERIRRSAQSAKDSNRAHRQERPIEASVELQGIIATPGGTTLAIVNGTTVGQGAQLSVAGHSAHVKVLRIGSTTVTFQYKNKRFNKTVSAE